MLNDLELRVRKHRSDIRVRILWKENILNKTVAKISLHQQANYD